MSTNYPPHPAAELFPMMTPDELAALAGDVQAHGLRESIWTYRETVLDGRNRLRACVIAGVEPTFREWDGPGDPLDFVLSLNLHRRHLTSEQKRAVVAAVLRAGPTRSNRQVGAQVGADHKTVSAVRQVLERRGEIPHVSETTDAVGRKQPARKGRGEIPHVAAATPVAVAPPAEEEPGPLSAAAALLGRRGGKRGGPARAKALTVERRQEIARTAANARWARE